jgi:hypothetical protein
MLITQSTDTNSRERARDGHVDAFDAQGFAIRYDFAINFIFDLIIQIDGSYLHLFVRDRLFIRTWIWVQAHFVEGLAAHLVDHLLHR